MNANIIENSAPESVHTDLKQNALDPDICCSFFLDCPDSTFISANHRKILIEACRMFEWLIFSLIFIILWLFIFAARQPLRKKMLLVSTVTSLMGFLEPVFIPAYWIPPSLFDLASKIRLDIESFIFLFAIGGIASVLYEAILDGELQKVSGSEVYSRRRSLHLASLLSAPIVFLLLLGLTRLNPIYPISIALFVGGIAATLCRPDLTKNTWVGGLLFAGLYFVFFFLTTLAFPHFVNSWNLSALSGILIFNMPLEEIMFAFTFGMLWSGAYEHILGYRLRKNDRLQKNS